MPGDLHEFLARVLWWPSDQNSGYNAVWWFSQDYKQPQGKPAWTVDGLVGLLDWIKGLPQTRNIYFCTSTQGVLGRSKRSGKPKAQKSKEAAVCSKCIFYDLDVEQGNPKKFASKDDALINLAQFLKDNPQLPRPSAIVDSGGGIQIYWINKTPLTRAEWEPYANGLKALALGQGFKIDPTVTGDMARIMRMPDTLNTKYTPPVRSKVLQLMDTDYDFATELAFLRDIAPIHAEPTDTQCEFDGPPDAAFLGVKVESLGAGIERLEMLPLDGMQLMGQCKFFDEAMHTKGAGFDQGLWNLSTLMAVFMENGNTLAHHMSKGHKDYTHDETEALWGRKNKEHAKGLGWPSCKSIEGAGYVGCALCPNYGKCKSPLNLIVPRSPPAPQAAPVTAAVTLPPGVGLIPLNLPEGYFEQNNRIYKQENDEAHLLFRCRIADPWIQADPVGMNFVCSLDNGEFTEVNVLHRDCDNSRLHLSLIEQSVTTEPKNKRFLDQFFMAWIEKLQAAKARVRSKSYGWSGPYDAPDAFSYNGFKYHVDGRVTPTAVGDAGLRRVYTLGGQKEPWMDAMHMICNLRSPGAECLLATGFTVPLMVFTGHAGAVLCVYSSESGAYKSTSLETALAVWGKPDLSKENEKSTDKSIIGKATEIRHLPVAWDEISELETWPHVHACARVFTEGAEGSRRERSGKANQDRKTFQTMMILGANHSYVDYLKGAQKTTEAGVMRVFEYEMMKYPEDGIGHLEPAIASHIKARLSDHYGHMGVEYAKLIAPQGPAIHARIKAAQVAFDRQMDTKDRERFWSSFAVTTIIAAELANQIGCDFHLPELRDFVYEQFTEQRKRHSQQPQVGNSVEVIESTLSGFFSRYNAQSIWTDIISGTKPVTVVHIPQGYSNADVVVQWAPSIDAVQFDLDVFKDYLMYKKIPSGPIMNGLVKIGATKPRVAMAAGTAMVSTQKTLVRLPVPAGSFMYPLMMRFPTDPMPTVTLGQTGGSPLEQIQAIARGYTPAHLEPPR